MQSYILEFAINISYFDVETFHFVFFQVTIKVNIDVVHDTLPIILLLEALVYFTCAIS